MPIRTHLQRLDPRPLGAALLDFVYPPLCPVCDAWMPPQDRQVLCTACTKALGSESGPRCDRCSAPTGNRMPQAGCPNCDQWPTMDFDHALVLTDFRGIAIDAVHCLKFNGAKGIGALMGTRMGTCPDLQSGLSGLDLLIPVPLHPARQRERGFNQAMLIATALGRVLGVPVDDACLRRVRPTRQQARLDLAGRRQNVKGVFSVARAPLGDPQRIGLVDDVMTTGATLSACAAALRSGFSGTIIAVTFASPFRCSHGTGSVDLIHSPT